MDVMAILPTNTVKEANRYANRFEMFKTETLPKLRLK
jgi:hypothetical protein